MRVNRIYTNAVIQTGHKLVLEQQASHHLAKVLRLKLDDTVILFNGDGKQYQASIHSIEKKHVTVTVISEEQTSTESPLNIHLGIAISKGDRMDWIIQKATELGVNDITPLLSERTEVKLKGERLQKKLLHWQHIAISACEQCGRNCVPTIHPMQTLANWAADSEGDKKWVLHHRSKEQLDASEQVNSAVLLIGPEGGLSSAEISLAVSQQFMPLQLGPRVMRTETAPVAAMAVLQHTWGDF